MPRGAYKGDDRITAAQRQAEQFHLVSQSGLRSELRYQMQHLKPYLAEILRENGIDPTQGQEQFPVVQFGSRRAAA